MSRERYVYDREQRRLVPIGEYQGQESSLSKITIIGDEMPETWHPCDGRYYTSKKKFRTVTRANGCEEVAGDRKFLESARNGSRPDAYIDDGSLRNDIIESLRKYE